MAFSIFSGWFDNRTKYIPTHIRTNPETGTPITRCSVLKKTLPTRRLIDQKDPHQYVNAASTDIRRWMK